MFLSLKQFSNEVQSCIFQALQSIGLYAFVQEGLGMKVNKQCTDCGVRPPIKLSVPAEAAFYVLSSYFQPTIISVQKAAKGPKCTSFPAILCSCHTPEISETE